MFPTLHEILYDLSHNGVIAPAVTRPHLTSPQSPTSPHIPPISSPNYSAMLSPPIVTTVFLTTALLATTLTFYSHLKWDPYPKYISCISEALFGSHKIQALDMVNDKAGRSRDCGHGKKIPLEVHIMSQCPDAKDCLEMMIAPTMEEVGDIVDFKMNFIGKQTHDGSISCLHGPSECLSNTIHLCASHIYPHTYLPFSLCLTHNYTLLPKQTFIESCASQHNVSFDKINTCISSLEPDGGLKLLKESVQRSHDVGAEVSCTVRVDEKVRCVRDGGEWKDCEGGAEVGDLVRKVKALYKKRGDGGEAREEVGENNKREGVEQIIIWVEKKGLMKQTKDGLRQLLKKEQIIWRG